jgi:hypothetical protein
MTAPADHSIEPAGDSALLIRFAPEISEARFEQVMEVLDRLRSAPIPGCVDLLPGYATPSGRCRRRWPPLVRRPELPPTSTGARTAR